jgi:hypothetical protein
MAIPLRSNQPEFDRPALEQPDFEREEITTADLAQGKRPASETRGPQPVVNDRAPQSNVGVRDVEGQDTGVQQTHDSAPLFPAGELNGLRTRWQTIQTSFVDEPRKAVEQADSLVASAMKRLAEVFAEERSELEGQWDRGESVSTEDLRVALQRYRAFFDRLLSV